MSQVIDLIGQLNCPVIGFEDCVKAVLVKLSVQSIVCLLRCR